MDKDEKTMRALFKTPAGMAWMDKALAGKMDEKTSDRLQQTLTNLKKKRARGGK